METAFVQGGALTRAKSLLSNDRRQNVASFNDRLAEFIADRNGEVSGIPGKPAIRLQQSQLSQGRRANSMRRLKSEIRSGRRMMQ